MADPVAQQAAINAMFQQAFSPIGQYGAARFALAREAQQRQLAEQQRQRQRGEALTDLQAQLGIRDEFQGKADARTAERQLVYLEKQMDLARENGDYAAVRNYGYQIAALNAQRLEGARASAAELGLEIDESKFKRPADFIAEVQKQAQARTRTNRGVATQANRSIAQFDREISELEAQMDAVAAGADISPEEELAIARRTLLGLATSDKERASFQKLNSLDAVYAAAAAADPTGSALGKALNTARVLKQETAKLKLGTLQRRADGLSRKRIAADRSLTMLAQRGIFPEPEESDTGAGTTPATDGANLGLPATTNPAPPPRQPNLSTFRAPAAAEPDAGPSFRDAFRREGLMGLVRPGIPGVTQPSQTQAALAAKFAPALRKVDAVNTELGAMIGPSAGARLADSAGRFLMGEGYNPGPSVAIEDVIGQMGQDAWSWLSAAPSGYVPVGGDDGRAALEQAAALGIDPRQGVVPGFPQAVAPMR